MSDLIQSGMAWLNEQRSASLSQTIRYEDVRGNSGQPVTITGSMISPERTEMGTFPMGFEGERVDFVIEADSLVFGGERYTPQNGDEITVSLNNKSCVYEVAAAAPGGSCWVWVDAFRLARRVHTKFKGIDE